MATAMAAVTIATGIIAGGATKRERLVAGCGIGPLLATTTSYVQVPFSQSNAN